MLISLRLLEKPSPILLAVGRGARPVTEVASLPAPCREGADQVTSAGARLTGCAFSTA